ncbi:DUF1176 domain-containing protein [Antarcticirhabdus aurantiaca]|uniref:DUF1176 domain-containing protein n=1 Tax=Antarcticirhabdus aurantiaca TaxID=2606717 RepID=A0ACD4NN40_9HYPH|nr:DUF1176 domain-containing protein [Antarcticirhabdus aurantiaca]WAJ28281.1 DUF1176 domain-containing protein [Jeongeuplla avenae]
MRMIPAALLLAVPALQPVVAENAPSRPDVGQSRSFNDWIVGCDNLRACTAIGTTADGAAAIAYIKVHRQAGPEARPQVSVVFLPQVDTAEAVLDLELAGTDATLAVEHLNARASDSYLAAPIGAADVGPFLDALLTGDALRVGDGTKGETAPVSLRGMSAALRYMDAEQGRAGGVTAIVAKGAAPADAVAKPAASAPARALKLVALDPAPPLPQGIPAPSDECPDGIEPEAYEASNGTRIFGSCSFSGAYNFGVDYWLSDATGVRPLDFRIPGQPGSDAFAGLVNAGLDEHGLTLIDFSKGWGIGDCGSTSSWSFDGETFQLVGLSSMGECRGVSASDWPVLYTRAISAEE